MKKILDFVKTHKGKAVVLALLGLLGALAQYTPNTLDDASIDKLEEIVKEIPVTDGE